MLSPAIVTFTHKTLPSGAAAMLMAVLDGSENEYPSPSHTRSVTVPDAERRLSPSPLSHQQPPSSSAAAALI